MGLHINMRLSHIDMQSHYETGPSDFLTDEEARNEKAPHVHAGLHSL